MQNQQRFFNKYNVQFSEEDLASIEGNRCKMAVDVHPFPEIGHYLVRPQGVYTIQTLEYSQDSEGYWDVQLKQIHPNVQKNDVILVTDKNRMFRCIKAESTTCEFQKIDILSLLQHIYNLEEKLSTRIDKMEKYINDLIQ